MTEPTTRTLDVPGAMLHYDIRTSESTTEPPLPLFGSPMPAGGFVTLASHFTDRTVVTYAPGSCQRRRRAQYWILDFGRTPNHCHYRSASRRRESRCQTTNRLSSSGTERPVGSPTLMMTVLLTVQPTMTQVEARDHFRLLAMSLAKGPDQVSRLTCCTLMTS
jgi:hypothetical protein